MPLFQYTARSKNGEKVSGTVAASSKNAAVEEIQRMGFFPIAVNSPSDHNLPAEKPGTISKLFPKQLHRLDYFLRWLLIVFAPGLISALLLPTAKLLGIPLWLPLLLVLLLFLLILPTKILCADIPRCRSIGWSPWLLLLCLVPGAGFVIQMLLFFVPPRRTDS